MMKFVSTGCPSPFLSLFGPEWTVVESIRSFSSSVNLGAILAFTFGNSRWALFAHEDCIVPKSSMNALEKLTSSEIDEEIAVIIPETCLSDYKDLTIKTARRAISKAKKNGNPKTSEDVLAIANSVPGGLESYAAEIAAQPTKLEKIDHIDSYCFLLSIPAFRRAGPMENAFTPCCLEFREWFIRAQRAGYECHVARNIYVHHLYGGTMVVNGIDRNETMKKNQHILEQFEAKFYGE